VVRLLAAGFAAFALLLSACSGSDSGTASNTPDLQDGGRAKAEKAKNQSDETGEEDFRYDPTGKADPFRSFVKAFLAAQESSATSPLEKFDLSQLHVSAIIWGNEDPRALISDPSGKGYIVSEGTSMGKNRGRVVRIDDNLVLVKETYVDFHGKATTKDIEMRLHPIQGG
jgi:type IV pilus assembly protein PilP